MEIKTRELSGLSSFSALQVFYKVMLGLKMFAAYAHYEPEAFFEMLEGLETKDQERFVREALLLVPLEKEDILCLAQFCADKNGVRYCAENMIKLKPDQLFEILVKSCMELVKIKIDFVSEAEKKKSETSQLI